MAITGEPPLLQVNGHKKLCREFFHQKIKARKRICGFGLGARILPGATDAL